MPKLKVNRYLQDVSCCAIASSASIANFYDNDIDYQKTREAVVKSKIVKSLDVDDGYVGMDSGDIGLLFNALGFGKVTIVGSDLNYLDYSWARLSKTKLLKKMQEAKGKVNKAYRSTCSTLSKFLGRSQYDNNLIINYNFGKFIRCFIDQGKPFVLCFNWNLFFKYPKQTESYVIDPFKGEWDDHAVVAYGYNRYGVNICDSHHQLYKYKLKKYRKGYYRIPWEQLMTVMGFGDIIIPENYHESG